MNAWNKPLNPHRQRGVAIVEFAVILPLVMLLSLATAELGRALYQQDTLTKAARDGARYLSATARFGSGAGLNATAFATARNRVLCGRDSCSDVTPLLPGMTIADVTATAPDPYNIIITARYPYQPMLGSVLSTFGIGPDISLNFNLTATVAMRIL